MWWIRGVFGELGTWRRVGLPLYELGGRSASCSIAILSAWLAYNNHHMSFGNHRTTPVISVTSVQYSTPVDVNKALDLLSQIESSFR